VILISTVLRLARVNEGSDSTDQSTWTHW